MKLRNSKQTLTHHKEVKRNTVNFNAKTQDALPCGGDGGITTATVTWDDGRSKYRTVM